MPNKDQLIYDTRNVNKSCDILSINYKHPITLTDNFEDFNSNFEKKKYTWNSPAAYIYSSLLYYTENKISLNNYEPETLAEVHKQLIEKETIYKTESILNDAISEKIKSDENFKTALKNTGNKKIEYQSPNNLLGTGNMQQGKNLLGKCYMKQRDALQIVQQKNQKSILIENAKKIIDEINNYYNNVINLLQNYKNLFESDTNFENIEDVEALILLIKEAADKAEITPTTDNTYNEYMNNTLPYGVNIIINSLKIQDLQDFDKHKEQIIKIVLKEYIGEYVNSITTIRNKKIMDAYVSFIIGEKFTATGPDNTSLNDEVKAKITQDIAKEQCLIFNDDGDICTKKIPQRLIELYKVYQKNSKEKDKSKEFVAFNEGFMETIMSEFNKYNLSEAIINSIMDFSIEEDNITLLEKILNQVNDFDKMHESDQEYIITTGHILSPTYREAATIPFFVDNMNQPMGYPDITSYYFVEMLRFINNSTDNSKDFYDLIRSKTDESNRFKSPVELSKLFNANYKEITREKLAKAVVRILNVKFACCSISCAALDALLKLPKNATIIWGSSNTILGMNNKKEGENLVGKYLSQIRASVEYRRKTALMSKSSASAKIKDALSDESKKKLFMSCVNKFNYQLNLYTEFKNVFNIDNEGLRDHDANCCKKFMMLLFSNCDLLHLIANNHINVTKIKNEIILLSKGKVLVTDNDDLIQWFWGFYILIASNVSDEIVQVIINKDNQNKTNENFKTQPEEYIKNFILTIISVLYYFINVYVNRHDNDDDKYAKFSYSKTIEFIKVIIFGNKDYQLDDIEISFDDAYIKNFYTSCKECVGITVDDNTKNDFKLLLNSIKIECKNNLKIENLVVYFNNPQFIFNRDINMPINA